MSKPSMSELVALFSQVEKVHGACARGKATPEQIDASEKALGVRIPSPFKKWLLFANGLVIPSAEVSGIGDSFEGSSIDARIRSVPRYRDDHFLPIGGDGCGNDYVIDWGRADGDQPVFFTDGAKGWDPIYVVASSIEHFLFFVLKESIKESGWPFTKNYVMSYDPKIVDVNGTMPWNA